jgi:hypothetical protein
MSGNLLIAADEDYQIGGMQVEVIGPAGSLVAARELPFAKQACAAEPREADVVFAGNGCGEGALPDLTGRIAALDGGGCTPYEKAIEAQRAGAAGFLLAQANESSFHGGDEHVTIPGAAIPVQDFNRLRNSRETVRVRLGPAPDNTWGYVRIFDIADATAPRQVGSFATENAKRCPAEGNRWYSVHNPFVAGDVAYLSWYSDGVRAVDISDPENPVEIGSFVIGGEAHGDGVHAARRQSSGRRHHLEETGEPDTFVWGVFVEDGLVYLSDEMTGLWIVRLKLE